MTRLTALILVLFSTFSLLFANPGSFNIRDFGAKGDRKSSDTKPIQSAIDACAKAGGGTVCFPAGKYISGTLFFKSNITAHLLKGHIKYVLI